MTIQPAKKVYDGYADTFAMEKISVGYDKINKTEAAAEQEYATLWYPPYNIRKTTATDYAIDLDVTGYDKREISAVIQEGVLLVTAPSKDEFPDPEKDDTFYHQGIFPGGDLSVKFYIADGLKLDTAMYHDGIITFTFKATGLNQEKVIVPVGPFDAVADGKPFVATFNSDGAAVAANGTIYAPGVPVVDPGAAPVTTITTTVVNAESNTVPTVEVNLPDPLPQIVEVAATVANTVDATSDTPQATINVKDATYEVQANNVLTDVIQSDSGKSDVVVATPVDVAKTLTDAGIDPAAAIKAAIDQTQAEAPPLPPEVVDNAKPVEVSVTPTDSTTPVTVVVPATLPSVVEATVDDGKVVLADTSETIPPTAELTPVVTAPGMSDIMVAVTPETQKSLDTLGVDVGKDISTAVIKADSDVAPAVLATPTLDPALAETSSTAVPIFNSDGSPLKADGSVDLTPPVAAPAAEVAPEIKTVVLNADDPTVPTVEVKLPDPLPQTVEVSAETNVPTVDPASAVPQVTLTVADATKEISNNVVTDTITLPDSKAETVVAVPEEVHADLDEKGVDVIQAVKDAVAEAAPTPAVDVPAPVAEAPVEAPAAPVKLPADTTFNSDGAPVASDGTLVTPEAAPAADVAAPAAATVAVTVPTATGSDTTTVTGVPSETTTVVLNADDKTVPTVEVKLPDPLPQIVEVSADTKATVDPVSTEPQVTLTVADATHEVSDNVVTGVIASPEGKADTVVAVPEEVHADLETKGVDVIKTVEEAVAKAEPAPAELPPATEIAAANTITTTVVDPITKDPVVDVVTPDAIPQVVEATVVAAEPPATVPTVLLSDASETVPANSEVIPVVTAPGQPDVMVAVSPEGAATLATANVDIATDVSKALVDEKVTVIPAAEPEAAVEPAANT